MFEYNLTGFSFVLDGLVGEVLFWSLRNCIGPIDYTFEVHVAWMKLYSRMLAIMVPVAVAYELRDGSAQEKRFFGQSIGLSKAEELALTTFENTAKPSQHNNASIYGAGGGNTTNGTNFGASNTVDNNANTTTRN